MNNNPNINPDINAYIKTNANTNVNNTNEKISKTLVAMFTILSTGPARRSPEKVQNLMNLTIEYVEMGGELDNETRKKIIDYLEYNHTDYYSKYLIVEKRFQESFKKIVSFGFRFSLKYLMHCMYMDVSLIQFVMNNLKNTITYAFACELERLRDYQRDYYNREAESQRLKNLYNQILAMKETTIKFTDDEKKLYIANPESNENIINMLFDDPMIMIDEKIMNNITAIHSLELLKKATMLGGVLNTKTLEIACISNVEKCEKIKFILDNKINPTRVAFHGIIESFNVSERRNRWDRNYDDKDRLLKIQQSIECLVDGGYKITYEDLKVALEKKIIIQNIDRFNITLDESYLEICSKISMYPYNVKNLKPDLTCLRNECKKAGNIQTIRKLIKESDLKPDTECLGEACKIKNNTQVIKLLIEKGAKLDINCLKFISDTIGNRALGYAFEIYMTQNPLAKKNDSMIDKSANTEQNETVQNDTEQNNSEQNNSVQNDSEQNDTEQNDTMSNDTMSNDTESMIQTNYETVNGVEKPKPNTMTINVSISIPESFSLSSPINEMIPDKIQKVLKLDDSEIDFLDFRSIVVSYFIKNKMITSDGIMLKPPFLHNNVEKIQLLELNNWIYGLLTKKPEKSEPDTTKNNILPNGKMKINEKKINEKKINEKITKKIKKKITSIADIASDDDESSQESVQRKERQIKRKIATKVPKTKKIET
jgi:hypothetical protein